MAKARRRTTGTSYYGTARRRQTRRKSTSVAVETAPKLSVAEIRQQLGNFKKQVNVPVTMSDLDGIPLNEVSAHLLRKVSASKELQGAENLRFKFSRGRDYYTKDKLAVVGERPYTDQELKNEGMKLIKNKDKLLESQRKAKQKKLDNYNKLARELGMPEVTSLDQLEKPATKVRNTSGQAKRNTTAANAVSNGSGTLVNDLSVRELKPLAKQYGAKGTVLRQKQAMVEYLNAQGVRHV